MMYKRMAVEINEPFPQFNSTALRSHIPYLNPAWEGHFTLITQTRDGLGHTFTDTRTHRTSSCAADTLAQWVHFLHV